MRFIHCSLYPLSPLIYPRCGLHNTAAACPHTLFPQWCTCGLNNLRQLLPYYLRAGWHSVSCLSWTVIYGFLPVLTAVALKYAGISGSIIVSVTQQVFSWNCYRACRGETPAQCREQKNDKYALFSCHFSMLLYMIYNTIYSVFCYRCRQSYQFLSSNH